jgi:hypothetical protein
MGTVLASAFEMAGVFVTDVVGESTRPVRVVAADAGNLARGPGGKILRQIEHGIDVAGVISRSHVVAEIAQSVGIGARGRRSPRKHGIYVDRCMTEDAPVSAGNRPVWVGVDESLPVAGRAEALEVLDQTFCEAPERVRPCGLVESMTRGAGDLSFPQGEGVSYLKWGHDAVRVEVLGRFVAIETVDPLLILLGVAFGTRDFGVKAGQPRRLGGPSRDAQSNEQK